MHRREKTYYELKRYKKSVKEAVSNENISSPAESDDLTTKIIINGVQSLNRNRRPRPTQSTKEDLKRQKAVNDLREAQQRLNPTPIDRSVKNPKEVAMDILINKANRAGLTVKDFIEQNQLNRKLNAAKIISENFNTIKKCFDDEETLIDAVFESPNKRRCLNCPVLSVCRTIDIELGLEKGVRWGLTEAERKILLDLEGIDYSIRQRISASNSIPEIVNLVDNFSDPVD